ncbi:MAG: hypothetical protein WBP68_03225, partial [Candidatus Binatus sp.]
RDFVRIDDGQRYADGNCDCDCNLHGDGDRIGNSDCDAHCYGNRDGDGDLHCGDADRYADLRDRAAGTNRVDGSGQRVGRDVHR